MWAIDLGTTNTGLARWLEAEQRPRVIALPRVCRQPEGVEHLEAPLLVPSLVEPLSELDLLGRLGGWSPLERRVLWGRQALIGREVAERRLARPGQAELRPFKPALMRAPLSTVGRVGGRALTAREAARLFLRELLREARSTTGERVRSLVVTSPVEAFEHYRAELSAILAGLGVSKVRFLDEPVAAALGYGLAQRERRRVLVVDFGGGTLDLALVVLTPRGIEKGQCEVLAKEGRPLGGGLVDRWLLEEACRLLGFPERLEDDELGGLWRTLMFAEVCRVKEALYFRDSEVLAPPPPDERTRFEARMRGAPEAVTFDRALLTAVLTRRGLYAQLEGALSALLTTAAARGVGEADVDDVLLVGGSTLLPGVYKALEGRFGRDRVRAWQPFEAVCLGAAAFAADAVMPSDFIVHDYAFVVHDPGRDEVQHLVVIPRGTRFPTATDFWKRQLVPTCSLGEPETEFKLVICEIGQDHEGEGRIAFDAQGRAYALGALHGSGKVVVPLNEAQPAFGYLKPPHPPEDRRPRLEISFGVNAERWLCASVFDLWTRRYTMREEPVVRLL
jgi:molecular chaperone DnaK